MTTGMLAWASLLGFVWWALSYELGADDSYNLIRCHPERRIPIAKQPEREVEGPYVPAAATGR